MRQPPSKFDGIEEKKQLFRFEQVVCNLCGGDDYKVFLESSDKTSDREKLFSTTSQSVSGERIVRCHSCGLVYVNPRFNKEAILSQYKSGEEQTYIKEAEARAAAFRRSLKGLRRYKKRGKLLDVGCAGGFFLKVAQDAGFNAIGVEPNKLLATWGEKHLGVKILPLSYEEAQFDSETFDIVTFWDVLEHLADPLSSLKKTNELLIDKGMLIVNYPDIDSVWARLFGRHWWFIVSGHLYYFSRDTISEMLEKAGFEVLEDRWHIQQLSFAYLLRQLGRYDKKVSRALFSLSSSIGLHHVIVPYWAGQRMVVARKIASVNR